MVGLVFALVVLLSSACAPPNPGGGTQEPTEPAGDGVPELSDAIINERINDAWVRVVPEENGAGEPITWGFDEDEPKEIKVVEKQIDVPHATVVLDVKTRSSLNSHNPRYLAGQIRTEWEIQTGWVLRRWEIVHAENISMKYRNLPKPSPSPTGH